MTNYMVKSGSGRICFTNPAKSGSSHISQKQIRYSPSTHSSSSLHCITFSSAKTDNELQLPYEWIHKFLVGTRWTRGLWIHCRI